MITGDVKNRIDQIWDVFFSAGITSPITVLEQMTYLFFIKLLDDSQILRERNAQIMNVPLSDKVFADGNWTNPDTGQEVPYAHLRWNYFKNLDGAAMLSLLRNEVFVFIKHISTGKDSAYSRFMKDALFMIPNERTLVRVVEGISQLDMNNKDAMGDVYEYILGKMAASGTNGQFRTPRHIIKMMVDLMQPALDETICDPAMGSAGFIVESAKYISEKYKNDLLNKKHGEHYRNTMFYGYDTDQTMLRIGAMNLMLHGVENPNIAWQDSLSDDNKETNKYSLVLANPPFKGSLDYNAVEKSLLTVARTKQTELLFISLFLRIMKLGGRCASIVPDGVLFGMNNAPKSIRKELVENQRLEAVISMPSGVFRPYAGVSTAVLIFTKTNAGGTDRVWFYDMQADGYSLDDKRSEVKENDIPDIIARFHKLEAEEERTRKEQSFFVTKEEIAQNDYDLSINKYKEIERVRVEYENPEVILARIEALQNEVSEAIAHYKTLGGKA